MPTACKVCRLSDCLTGIMHRIRSGLCSAESAIGSILLPDVPLVSPCSLILYCQSQPPHLACRALAFAPPAPTLPQEKCTVSGRGGNIATLHALPGERRFAHPDGPFWLR